MKTRIQIGAAAIALLALVFVTVACFDRIDILSSASQTQQVNPVPSPTPTPAPAGCDVRGLGVGLKGAPGVATIPVNSDEVLDATPRGDQGPLPDNCPVSPIVWDTPGGTAACSLSNQTSYNPTLRCSSIGQVTVRATVSGASASATFTVQ